MTIKIKVCGITKEKEVKQLEKLNIEHIGFINIKRSQRNVSLDQIEKIEKIIINKSIPTLVLEPDDPYDVVMKINRLNISNIQLHSLNNFDIRYIKWLSQYYDGNYINITKAIGLNESITCDKKEELIEFSKYADNIILDYQKNGNTGGTNRTIPINTAIEAAQIIKQTNNNTTITLAGGLNLDYLSSIIDKLNYFDKIDLNSGVEIKPGIKDIHKIKKIIKLVHNVGI